MANLVCHHALRAWYLAERRHSFVVHVALFLQLYLAKECEIDCFCAGAVFGPRRSGTSQGVTLHGSADLQIGIMDRNQDDPIGRSSYPRGELLLAVTAADEIEDEMIASFPLESHPVIPHNLSIYEGRSPSIRLARLHPKYL
jgi:hypothetical protein